MRNPLPARDRCSVVGVSVKDHAGSLQTAAVELSTALRAVRRCMTSVGDVPTLGDVSLSGIRISLSIESSQPYSQRRLFTYFSLCFLRDSSLDFIFPRASPCWLLAVTLISCQAGAQQRCFLASQAALPGRLYSSGAADQAGRRGPA